jgi:hypothetical protein
LSDFRSAFNMEYLIEFQKNKNKQEFEEQLRRVQFLEEQHRADSSSDGNQDDADLNLDKNISKKDIEMEIPSFIASEYQRNLDSLGWSLKSDDPRLMFKKFIDDLVYSGKGNKLGGPSQKTDNDEGTDEEIEHYLDKSDEVISTFFFSNFKSGFNI